MYDEGEVAGTGEKRGGNAKTGGYLFCLKREASLLSLVTELHSSFLPQTVLTRSHLMNNNNVKILATQCAT